MTRRQRLGVYVRESTANPTGWRPWNSRLSYYTPAAFSVPTSSLSTPRRSLGLGSVKFPNFATFSQSRSWRSHAGYPTPVYQSPGLGAVAVLPASRRGPSIVIPRANPPSVNQPPSVGLPPTVPRGGTVTTYPATQYPGYMPPVPVIRSAAWSFAPHATAPQPATIAPSQPGYFVTSSPETGSITSFVPAPGVSPLTSQQYAALASQPASAGSPYSNAAQEQAAAEAAAAAAQAAAATATPASSAAAAPSWFTEDSLGFGLPNIAYAAIAVGGVLLLKGRK